MNKISQVLVANRGEIAVRIIRACRELELRTVLAVSDADRDSLPARMADRAVCIGPSRSVDSYLRTDLIITAALGTGSQAIHPGYGFLCEQAQLPEACNEYGLTFIGPTAENIRKMGDKNLARRIAASVGVPIVPGTDEVRTDEEAVAAANRVGYPVLLKAAAGGGGRGILVVAKPEDLKANFDVASAEAHAAFGDGRLYIERYFPNARHIEVQVLGDGFGHVVHLGERDCSLQRRYQKLLEEGPSPVLSDALRDRVSNLAVSLAQAIGYENAGTVEFIFDLDTKEFYFIEMNTRIQVEHGVTEVLTGIDLVKQQILIADGHPLSITQSAISPAGHAIECRINAESPEAGFQPCPGRIVEWRAPSGDGVRVDTHCYAGYAVPPYYDSLLAKVIAWGENRRAAIERMKRALADFTVSGLSTTIPLHQATLDQPDFLSGRTNTKWVEDRLLPSLGYQMVP